MKILVHLLLLSVSACMSTTTIATKQVDLPPANAPEIAPLNLVPFNWRIINDQDLKRMVGLLPKTSGNHILLFSLDENNYAIFDSDLLELQRYIEEQDAVITFYKGLEDNRVKDSHKGQK